MSEQQPADDLYEKLVVQIRETVQKTFRDLMPEVDQLLLAGAPHVRVVIFSRITEARRYEVSGACLPYGDVQTQEEVQSFVDGHCAEEGKHVAFDRVVDSTPALLDYLRNRQ